VVIPWSMGLMIFDLICVYLWLKMASTIAFPSVLQP
jgi:hypothetical protein